MNVPHSDAFFNQMRTCRDSYRLLADCFDEVLTDVDDEASRIVEAKRGRPLTGIDIGCGTGAQTARLAELGWTMCGVDVFDVRPEPGFAFRKLDVIGLPASVVYDVVFCTETAEHVVEERANALVEAVASRAGQAIVWSAAVPGQEWEGHVNLQPHEYWLDKFARLGCVVLPSVTDELRKLIVERRAQHWMAVNNFYVMRARDN